MRAGRTGGLRRAGTTGGVGCCASPRSRPEHVSLRTDAAAEQATLQFAAAAGSVVCELRGEMSRRIDAEAAKVALEAEVVLQSAADHARQRLFLAGLRSQPEKLEIFRRKHAVESDRCPAPYRGVIGARDWNAMANFRPRLLEVVKQRIPHLASAELYAQSLTDELLGRDDSIDCEPRDQHQSAIDDCDRVDRVTGLHSNDRWLRRVSTAENNFERAFITDALQPPTAFDGPKYDIRFCHFDEPPDA